jgi:D-arabinose 1-dehydrogenase-like Zn-dependent alcohol dehydrogenase
MGREVHAYSHSEAKFADAIEFGASFAGFTAEPRRNEYDLVLVTTSAAVDLSQWMRALRPRGVLCLLGLAGEPIQFPPGQLVGYERTVTGGLTASRAGVRRALTFAAENGVRPRVEVVPFREAAAALLRFSSGEARYRLVLTHE